MRSQVVFTAALCAATVVLALTLSWLLCFYKTQNIVTKGKSRPKMSTSVSMVDHSCHSLFTITDFTNGNELETLSTYTIGQDLANASSLDSIQKVARVVRNLQHMRDTLSGVTTAHYRTVASLLPPLVTFHNQTVTPKADEAPNPTLAGVSRISVAGGMLPYVPCAILPYDDPASFTSCLRKRLRSQGSFRIEFMGDSKIRSLYYAFLRRTNQQLQYQISVQVACIFPYPLYVSFTIAWTVK